MTAERRVHLSRSARPAYDALEAFSQTVGTIAAEVAPTNELIETVTGVRTTYFRAPGLTQGAAIDAAVLDAIARHGGNKKRAAAQLRISRSHLYKILERGGR